MEHQGGFTPFEAEINAFIRRGSNRLTVAVNNIVDDSTIPVGHYAEMEIKGLGKMVRNTPNFDFFNYSGIHRPVRIYTTPQTYVEDITVVTDYAYTTGIVAYQLRIKGDAEARVSIIDEFYRRACLGLRRFPYKPRCEAGSRKQKGDFYTGTKA
ncbi:Beta-glucuronidase [compost metagenome]